MPKTNLIKKLQNSKLEDQLSIIEEMGDKGDENDLIYLLKEYDNIKINSPDKSIEKLKDSLPHDIEYAAKGEKILTRAVEDSYGSFLECSWNLLGTGIIGTCVASIVLEIASGGGAPYMSERGDASVTIGFYSAALHFLYKTAKIPFKVARNAINSAKRNKIDKLLVKYNKE